jgi:hypothetical protein
MVVATFVAHLRSELALHRFDLVADDETSRSLLGQSELTDHAVTVLGRALVARGAAWAPVGFSAVIAAPGASDVAVVVDDVGPRLERSDARLEPAVVGDPAARLLLLWGRQPGDPRRLAAPSSDRHAPRGILVAIRGDCSGHARGRPVALRGEKWWPSVGSSSWPLAASHARGKLVGGECRHVL